VPEVCFSGWLGSYRLVVNCTTLRSDSTVDVFRCHVIFGKGYPSGIPSAGVEVEESIQHPDQIRVAK
jgi:hypothetical protein